MTEQEKELGIYIAECVNGLPDSGDNFNDCFTLAKALIQRYPQILSEKVWKGRAIQVETIERSLMCNRVWRFKNGFDQNIEIFIREIKE